jgi:hypothetical protein
MGWCSYLGKIDGNLKAYHRYDEGELLEKDGFVKNFQRLLRALNNKTGAYQQGRQKTPELNVLTQGRR